MLLTHILCALMCICCFTLWRNDWFVVQRKKRNQPFFTRLTSKVAYVLNSIFFPLCLPLWISVSFLPVIELPMFVFTVFVCQWQMVLWVAAGCSEQGFYSLMWSNEISIYILSWETDRNPCTTLETETMYVLMIWPVFLSLKAKADWDNTRQPNLSLIRPSTFFPTWPFFCFCFLALQTFLWGIAKAQEAPKQQSLF